MFLVRASPLKTMNTLAANDNYKIICAFVTWSRKRLIYYGTEILGNIRDRSEGGNGEEQARAAGMGRACRWWWREYV